MTARTDAIRSVREAAESDILAIQPVEGEKRLVSRGTLGDFVAAYAQVETRDGGIVIDPEAATLLDVTVGDRVCHVARW